MVEAAIHQKQSDEQIHDRFKMLKAFDETKTGVKGLLDSGLQKIPQIFVRPSEELSEELTYKDTDDKIQVPVIDLGGINDDGPDRRKRIIEEVRSASETWGFFQVVNHGIPQTMLDAMIDGIRKFHEGDVEEKKRYFSRDYNSKVSFNANYDLYQSKTANWRDTLNLVFPAQVDKQELPSSCRDITVEYSNQVAVLANTLLELFSVALGLKPDHLFNLECSKGYRLCGHYYPPCPEPALTLGTSKHSDASFFTILLQNEISGLQVFCQDQWVNVNPVPGALVVNIGDFLQLVSNGKFKSIKHRALVKSIGPRISAAYFLSGPTDGNKIYRPIEELISEENPAKYKEILLRDFIEKFLNSELDKNIGLDLYRL